jgi:RNA recognition motif-containing protein
VTDHQLQQAFTTYGSLTRVRIVRDRKSGKSKGYGFVAFREPQDFLQALREMNGKYVGSRPIKLKKSNWTDRCADPSDTKKRRL